MSTAGRSAPNAAGASDVAAVLGDAGLAVLHARADGDAVAATGILAAALTATGTPFHTRVAWPGDRPADVATDADVTIGIGLDAGEVRLCDDGVPESVTAYTAARELGADPDPVLGLAGAVAAGRAPGEFPELVAAARDGGRVERRPGIAAPTGDLADGLAHTTLAHAPFSGDLDEATDGVAGLDLGDQPDDGDRRRVASHLALAVGGVDGATPRAAESVERALRPYALVGSRDRFATVGGFGDVLDGVARERPGLGIALALGHGAREEALDAWRRHAARAHAGVREATTARYDGLLVVRVSDAPVGTTARLLRDFRSPEPVTVVLGDGEAGAAAVEDRALGELVAGAAEATGGSGGGTARRAHARIDRPDAFVSAVREAL